MNNNQIINAVTVLRDVLKAARLDYGPAEAMIKDLKENPVVAPVEVERAFCAGFICNLKSMADFDGDRILKMFEAYKNSSDFKVPEKIG